MRRGTGGYRSAARRAAARHSRHRASRAFTLVELLVVLLLMGMIYALAFNHFLPKSQTREEERPKLSTVERLFKKSPLYRRREMILYGLENGECYLVSEGRILQTVHLPRTGTGYRLNPDETLQSIDYPHVRVQRKEFIPLFTIRCRRDGYFDPQIIQTDEKWLYIHPFERARLFDNPSDMVAYIRQSDYLPDRAGYAQ